MYRIWLQGPSVWTAQSPAKIRTGTSGTQGWSLIVTWSCSL